MKNYILLIVILFLFGCGKDKQMSPALERADIATSVGSHWKYKITTSLNNSPAHYDTLLMEIASTYTSGGSQIIRYASHYNNVLIDSPVGILTNGSYEFQGNYYLNFKDDYKVQFPMSENDTWVSSVPTDTIHVLFYAARFSSYSSIYLLSSHYSTSSTKRDINFLFAKKAGVVHKEIFFVELGLVTQEIVLDLIEAGS